jgi:thiol:disulfide interchange protein DsbD
MGTGAGLVASPCTGPVLAFFLSYSAREASVAGAIGLLFTYSLGFALPYVFLGSFAAKASVIKVHPRIQVGVKTVFAAVMFGLGLYYLRIPFYRVVTDLAAYWRSAALVLLGAGLLAMAAVLLSPTRVQQKGSLVLVAVLLGGGIFSSTQWLGRSSVTPGEAVNVTWLKSEEEALKIAAAENRPLMIDHWAEWCEACKKMEASTFVDPGVIDAFKAGRWVLLKMDLTESNEQTDALIAKYGIKSLPTLTLVNPSRSASAQKSIQGFTTAPVLINQLRAFEGASE